MPLIRLSRDGPAPELKIKINFKSNEFNAIIDTGAMVNVIKSKHVRGKILKSDVGLRAANQTKIKVLGETELEFRIGKREYKEVFIVSDDITSEMILGLEFCYKGKIILDFGRDQVFSHPKVQENSLGEHSIITKVPYPIVSPMYRLGPELEDEAAKIIGKHLKE